jgi:hypothetical protein
MNARAVKAELLLVPSAGMRGAICRSAAAYSIRPIACLARHGSAE